MTTTETIRERADDLPSRAIEIRDSETPRKITITQEKFIDIGPALQRTVSLDHVLPAQGEQSDIEVMSYFKLQGIDSDEDREFLMVTAIDGDGYDSLRPNQRRLCTVLYCPDGTKTVVDVFRMKKSETEGLEFLKSSTELPDVIDYQATVKEFQMRMLQRDFTDPPLILPAPVLSGQTRVAL